MNTEESVLEDPPACCVRCGSMVEELEELALIASNAPVESPFHGKVPYICMHVACKRIMYAPSRKHPKGCCF